MKKILLPGIIAGIVTFFWGYASHELLSIGTMGIRTAPASEDAVLSALKSNIQQPGFYFMPGPDMSGKATAEQMKAWQAKWEAGPTAIVVFNPSGGQAMSVKQLLRQLLFQILCGLIAACIVSAVAASLATRAVMVGLMGLFAWLAVSLPQWNWYNFPKAFVIGVGLDQIIGWLIGGFVIAWLIKRAEK